MRAIVQDAYGTPEVLRTAEVPVPDLADDDVLVRVHAAGVDRGTWHLTTGRPYLMRVLGFGLRRPRNRVAGLDLAGTVTAVGPAVTRFVVGDQVLGIGRGSFAEYAAAPERKLALKPAGTAFEEAAAVAVSGLTAYQGLHEAGRLVEGQRVLVLGASGGVGSFAVQLAKAAGAEVTGVCSTAKVDLVRSLGADRVLDYTVEDFADPPGRYDLILDAGGGSPLPRLRRALTPSGTLVIVGSEQGGRWTGGFGRQLRAAALSPFVRQRLVMLVSREDFRGRERLVELVGTGAVVPSIGRVYPLADASRAVADLEAGRARGKLVLTVPQRAE